MSDPNTIKNPQDYFSCEQHYGANNYAPLPVVLTRGAGVHVWDVLGKRYLDMMSAYSAVSHGHCHPKLVAVLQEQASQLCVTSRAYFNNKLGAFLQKVCELTGFDKALPMNTGAEAVETALKAARKWAYTVKSVPQNKAEIIACDGNFHGRTISIVAMSSEEQYKNGFGPFPEGMKRIPYGDADALSRAITPNTAAFIVEPIQGEGGIVVPPEGYLKACEKICRDNNVLLIIDEVQTGLGRTGSLLACHHDNVKPDGVILGKALGGGLLPVSVFLAKKALMDVFTPGDHGSTFGGNPLAAAVGLRALELLSEENLIENSRTLGLYFLEQLRAIDSALIKQVRGRGLLMGVEIDPNKADAHDICLDLLAKGILSKETHHTVIRFAPPLVVTKSELNEVVLSLKTVLAQRS